MAIENTSYDLYMGQRGHSSTVTLRCDGDGKVEIGINSHSVSASTKPESSKDIEMINTTADQCSWNLFASKKPLRWNQLLGRPQLLSTSSDGYTIKVGGQIFFLQANNVASPTKTFTPNDFSLLLDHVEQHGRYLFVTSREKVLEVPEVEDETPEDTKANDKDIKAENSLSDSADTKNLTENKNPDAKVGSDSTASTKGSKKDEVSSTDIKVETTASDSEPDDSGSENETSVADEELSAYESWSEASTDLEEEGIRPVADLCSFPNTLPAPIKAGKPDADAEFFSSSSSDDSYHSDSGTPSSSDDESVSGSNARYAKELDNEEEDNMFEKVFFDDRIEAPDSDDSDNNDDRPPEGVWSETGYALAWQDDDFDGFMAFESDSEDCSECGDDGGKACALPESEEKSSVEEKSETAEEEDLSPPQIGAPIAQIHVYDTTTFLTDKDGKQTMKRLFRFQQPTLHTPLHSSPPAIHPKKSLVVWPIGASFTTKSGSTILFADYKYNTYFLKKLRFSRLFSQHVSIQCRFSASGDYLHIAALERLGEPPQRTRQPKKKGKKASKAKIKVERPKKEAPSYDLIVSTYRMSKGKTVRAPPTLVHQVKQHLGRIPVANALPTYAWSQENVFITYTGEREVKLYQVELHPSRKQGKVTGDECVRIRAFPIQKHEELAEKELHYILSEANDNDSETCRVLALEPTHLKPFIKPKEKGENEKQKEEIRPKEDEKETQDRAKTSAAPASNSDTAKASQISTSTIEDVQPLQKSTEPVKEIAEVCRCLDGNMKDMQLPVLRLLKLADLV